MQKKTIKLKKLKIMKKFIILLCITVCFTYSCNKVGVEELIEEVTSNTMTVTSVKQLDMSELLDARPMAKSANAPQIANFESFEVRKEIDGVVGNYGARMVIYEPVLANKTIVDILEPASFETYISMHIEEIAQGNYIARYYDEGELFMEATMVGNQVVVQSKGRFWNSFKFCVVETFRYIENDTTLTIVFLASAVHPYGAAGILGGLAIGCGIFAL
jgi:hypothetical protein